ncbi:response regulator transcription factor [Cellulophaga omnivescoria]|uniref:response regulator transcription factor n=1 Tax=Cellulophaga omnivescoria TaxID=1888890 RepID=UPI0011154B73|nr:response regulator transcription factor [Cellulophaga omnivescoria]
MYSDKAYNRAVVAYKNNVPFQLLVTDLQFKEGYTDRKLTSGIELINAIERIQHTIKVIVNSMEDYLTKIKALFKEQKMNGFVCKGRENLNEHMTAIQDVYNGNSYVSPQINMSSNTSIIELDDFEAKNTTHLIAKLTRDGII